VSKLSHQDVGTRYGKLVTVSLPYLVPGGRTARVRVQCACGTRVHEVLLNNLRKGNTTSCGCLRYESDARVSGDVRGQSKRTASFDEKVRAGKQTKTSILRRYLVEDSCYLCGSMDFLHLDHDHSCPHTHTNACVKCVRGLLCQRHNTQVGHVEAAIREGLVKPSGKLGAYLARRPLWN
jgi:hypothetical protein